MRRAVALLTLVAALGVVSSSPSALQPVRRSVGEVTLPRLRAGVIQVPKGQASGRVSVLVDLPLAPLAAYDRELASARSGSFRRLDVASESSRAYLARLARAQRAAAARLRRALPQARIYHRYRVILDGFALSLPARRLPELARLPFITHVYPSLGYQLNLNRSPSVIGASALWAATGARGDGVKIGVVDDGVDPTNPFLDPSGFSYPSGFPKGVKSLTTPKVIVARAFPPPGFGPPSTLALDRRQSFHGTHVAGIAAGDADTTAPPGPDHPAVSGLSGIAPRAWLGNYRVFNRPTPIGNDAFTPEIVAAFEAAVADGMDVINFSGGGPQVDPNSDAIVEAVRNVVNAGVLPVIAAGNDRDDFGLGSVGTPGTAPDAVSVAAVSNTHVFAPALSVVTPDAPPNLKQIPFQSNGLISTSWQSDDQTLVDVGSIVGTDGSPVDRHLCGPPSDPNTGRGNWPTHSLDHAIALVFRGSCTFFSKALRAQAAGAIGIVLVDNRPGEANPIPIQLPLSGGMISDLDGARVLQELTKHGGRAPIRVSIDPLEIETGRSGVITSFSSAGPADFGHLLKPDVAAPGGQILSSTLPEFAQSPFAVFDGTSMATPHVTGAVALLIQRHRSWTPRQIKSALMSTAGPAWADTARTVEAPVTLEGSGLVNVAAADDPKIFTDPVSLSFGDLDVNHGAQGRTQLVGLTDAGDGAGTWQVQLKPQSATAGASLDVGSSTALAPGGTAEFAVTVRAGAGAATGDNYGFLLLQRGADTRRIPYWFSVTRPGLESASVAPLKQFVRGDTAAGTSHATAYRFPSAPFGPAPDYSGPPLIEDGAEQVFVTHVNSPVANFGAAVIASSSGALIDPWLLGSLDENDVQGYAGTPVDVNVMTFDYRSDIGAVGAVFPRTKRYYIAVDSGRDRFTGQSFAGRYILRSWMNDVTPPRIRLLTRRVTAGRPMIAARIIDRGAGVDPASLVIGYKRVLVGAALYDPFTGLALFPLPNAAPRIGAGRTGGEILASDFQESKNVDQAGAHILPNTAVRSVTLKAVRGPAITWLVPDGHRCIPRSKTPERLVVAATAAKRITAVRFFDGRRRIGTVTRGIVGLFAVDWPTSGARSGLHTLRAVVSDRHGASASTRRVVRVCR